MEKKQLNREPLWLALGEMKPVALARDLIAHVVHSFPTHDPERMKEYEQWPSIMSYQFDIMAADLNETNYLRIKEAGKLLETTLIYLHDDEKKKHFDSVVLLTRFSLLNGKITMMLNGALVPHLADLKKYSVYNFKDFLSLRGYYAKQLFEIFGAYVNRDSPGFKMEIHELKTILGLSDKYNGRINNFKQRVIDPAIIQINEATEINVDHELKRKDKTTYIHFDISRKDGAQVKELPPAPVQDQEPEPVQEPGIPFETFWDLYDYKKGKKNALRAWDKLTDEQRDQAIKAVPPYVKNTCKIHKGNDPRPLRAYPATWLNAERWEDEIVDYTETEIQTKQHGSYEYIPAE